MPPFTLSRFLVLDAFVLAVIGAALLLLGNDAISLVHAVGVLFVVLAIYLASLLVP